MGLIEQSVERNTDSSIWLRHRYLFDGAVELTRSTTSGQVAVTPRLSQWRETRRQLAHSRVENRYGFMQAIRSAFRDGR